MSEPVVVMPPGTSRVRLAAPLVWRDPQGAEHCVPVGFWSDGATIPRWAWWLVGGPLDGPYRRAAILHDWQCVVKVEPAATVHRRFYRAMRADGVPAWIAGLFYGVVQLAGPRWPSPERRSA
jgi:hypothetical protein